MPTGLLHGGHKSPAPRDRGRCPHRIFFHLEMQCARSRQNPCLTGFRRFLAGTELPHFCETPARSKARMRRIVAASANFRSDRRPPAIWGESIGQCFAWGKVVFLTLFSEPASSLARAQGPGAPENRLPSQQRRCRELPLPSYPIPF